MRCPCPAPYQLSVSHKINARFCGYCAGVPYHLNLVPFGSWYHELSTRKSASFILLAQPEWPSRVSAFFRSSCHASLSKRRAQTNGNHLFTNSTSPCLLSRCESLLYIGVSEKLRFNTAVACRCIQNLRGAAAQAMYHTRKIKPADRGTNIFCFAPIVERECTSHGKMPVKLSDRVRSSTIHCVFHAKQLETSNAFHTTRSPTEEDKGACAVLAQAIADGSDEAEGVLEVSIIL